MNISISPSELNQRLSKYRTKTFRSEPHLRLKNQSEAIQFVNDRGFTFFWPITGIIFPSLWVAVAGERPVADQHDDPAHITWRWKDNLLGSKEWYYAKVLRKKATIISLQSLPYFYALSRNYGSPDEDHLILYEQGLLSIEEKLIYEALLHQGPLDTLALKREAHLSSRQNESRFDRALASLQSDFKIIPIGIAEVGAWRYAYIYEITTRYLPEIIENTRFIDETTARQYLLRQYFLSVGGAKSEDVIKLFHWTLLETTQTLQVLLDDRFLTQFDSINSLSVKRFFLTSLIN